MIGARRLGRIGILGLAAMTLMSLASGAARAADQLRVGVQFGIAYIPFYVAEHEGLLRKHLDANGVGAVAVSFPRFSGSPALNDAVFSGQVDMAVYAPTALAIAWDKTRGTSAEIVGVCGVTDMQIAMVTLKPEIRSVKDIGPDDRIVTPSAISTSAYLVRIAAEEALGDGNAFNSRLVSMPNPDAVTAMLSKRDVSVLVTAPPYTDWLRRQPGAHRVWRANDILGEPSAMVVLGATKRYTDANPALVRALIAALDEANAMIAKDPGKAARIYLGYEPSKTFDEAFITELLGDGEHPFTTSVHGFMRYADYLTRHNELKTKPSSWKDVFLPIMHDRPGS